jgi:hypothetical protein
MKRQWQFLNCCILKRKTFVLQESLQTFATHRQKMPQQRATQKRIQNPFSIRLKKGKHDEKGKLFPSPDKGTVQLLVIIVCLMNAISFNNVLATMAGKLQVFLQVRAP